MSWLRTLKKTIQRSHEQTGDHDEDPTMKSPSRIRQVAALLLISSFTAAHANDGSSSPLRQGAYIAPMVSGYFTDDEDGLDDGVGGTLALGFRRGFYALEIIGTSADLKTATIAGFGLNALLFPLSSLPNVYLTAGLSGLNYKDYATSTGDKIDFNANNVDGGVGFIWPLSWGRYDYGIRSEVRYRAGRRERDFNDLDIDIDAPRSPNHVVLNLGLQLPTRLNPPPPPPTPEPRPLTVVAPEPPLDSDGDGVPDDRDDCPNTPQGVEVDARGCPLLCQAATPGQPIALGGCKSGDSLTLVGVNFMFDSADLELNAQAILDGVAAELKRYTNIRVELSGHTDSRGAEAYNQRLSERRAESVKRYLEEQGIAASRMTALGFGETKPVEDNNTDGGRERNRRVELKVIVGNGDR